MDLDPLETEFCACFQIVFTGTISFVLKELFNVVANDRGETVYDLIRRNSHTIYHLYSKFRCCQCTMSAIPMDVKISKDNLYTILFKTDPSDITHRYGKHDACSCKFVPYKDSKEKLHNLDFIALSSILVTNGIIEKRERDSMKKLKEYRNKYIGHPSKNAFALTLGELWDIWRGILSNLAVLVDRCPEDVKRNVERQMEELTSDHPILRYFESNGKLGINYHQCFYHINIFLFKTSKLSSYPLMIFGMIFHLHEP